MRSRSEEDSLALLLKSAVDYTLMDELVVEYIVDHHPEEARTRLQFGARPLITRQLFFAVRRTLPDAPSIIDRFNAQLRAMITDHTYHKLLHVAWISVDVDGDGQVEYVPDSDKAGAGGISGACGVPWASARETRQGRRNWPATKTPASAPIRRFRIEPILDGLGRGSMTNRPRRATGA